MSTTGFSSLASQSRPVSPVSSEQPYHPVSVEESVRDVDTDRFQNIELEQPPRVSTSSDCQHESLHGHNNGATPPLLAKPRSGTETISVDIFSIGVPLGLLVFTILLMLKKGKEGPLETVEKWQNAASVLSTSFPILFSAIAGRLMMQAARWKLEQGVSVGSLEQLVGSRTVGGAIVTQFHLRSFSILSILILFLWVFSPLGAQSILRVVEPGLATVLDQSNVAYFDTFGKSPADNFILQYELDNETQVYMQAKVDLMNQAYGAMLLAPTAAKNGNMDLWGNVKVPMIPLQSSDGKETDSWVDVSSNSDRLYSSLLGIPIQNITVGNSTFDIESTYVVLDCDKAQKWNFNDTSANSTHLNYLNQTFLQGLFTYSNGQSFPPNGTFQGYSIDRENNTSDDNAAWSIGIDRFIDQNWTCYGETGSFVENRSKTANLPLFENETNIDAGPTRILIEFYIQDNVYQDSGLTEYSGTSCLVKQKYVKSRVKCEKRDLSDQQNCTVVAQRPSRKRSRILENLTMLSFPDTWRVISNYWPPALGSHLGKFGTLDPTLQYLSDPTMQPMIASSSHLNMTAIDKKDLSIRLGQVLNTYIAITSIDISALNPGSNGNVAVSLTADARVEHVTTVYVVPPLWSTLCIVSNLILLAAGLASTVFAHVAGGPEILGYATTALRRNNMKLSKDTETMNGLELTQELKKRRVRYGWSKTGSGDEGATGVGDEKSTVKIRDLM